MKLDLIEVKSEEQYTLWYKLYTEIFPKPEDQFPKDFIWKWFKDDSETQHAPLLISYNDKIVGFIWQMINRKIKTAYYYYMGILENFRSRGIFTNIQPLNEKYLIKNGIELILAEPENPRLMKSNKEVKEAIRRIKFYTNRISFLLVSDKNIRYLRVYPPDKFDKVQDYYMMSFKPLTSKVRDSLIEKNKLSKEGYKQIYLNQTQLELGIKKEKILKSKSKAANLFLNKLDKLDHDINLIGSENVEEYIESLNKNQ